MKFMKLGSKDDTFQSGSGNTRFVKSELTSDIVVTVGDVKFYLHKFPLLSRSGCLKRLLADVEGSDEVDISEIPGGPAAFEICAKFCYGMTVTLNAYNVLPALCAAQFLGMDESVEKGNLVYKIEAFLSSSIFRSWKDCIIVLQNSQNFMAVELRIVSNCIEAIATKACIDVAKVDWSYSYNRRKLPEENGIVDADGCSRLRSVPRDWWVEDLCELEIDLYKQVIVKIRSKCVLPEEVIGESLKAYAYRRLLSCNMGKLKGGELEQYQAVVSSIVLLLPDGRGCVSCSFLLKVLKAAILVQLDEDTQEQLVRRIGQQLEEARVQDLLIPANGDDDGMYNVDVVKKMVKEFLMRDHCVEIVPPLEEVKKVGVLSAACKLMVGKLIDGYLAEIAGDPKLSVGTFVEVAEIISSIPRPCHDAIYRAIDMFLKEHPDVSKSERKRICRLMDCKKLSMDACMHAVQNERLPLRVVVQVLFFEQIRLAATSGSTTPDLPKGIRDLNNGSYRSSRSAATNPDEDWDAVASAEELRALKGEIAALKLGIVEKDGKVGVDKASHCDKGLLKSKIFAKLWANKAEKNEISP